MKEKELKLRKKYTNNNNIYKKAIANVLCARRSNTLIKEQTKLKLKHHLNLKSKNKILTSNAIGITLIALIITIIVMLILVGVTVNVAINGGLFSTAKRAVSETQKAREDEQRLEARVNASMHNEKWEYESADGTKIPIPAGFAPTEIEGENTIDEGIVITDADGNEFVWIPCKAESTDEGDNNLIVYNEERDSEWKTKQNYYNGGTWGDSQPHNIGIPSIRKNKGFYVARYEAGVPENAPFYAYKDGDLYQRGNVRNNIYNLTMCKPVSKKGAQVWNYISQKSAKEVSENMYTNNDTVESYLIDSHAWDTICRIMKKNCNKDILDSNNWGNYYNNSTTKYEDLYVLYAKHIHVGTNSWEYANSYTKGYIPSEVIPRGNEEIKTRIELSTGASEDFKAYNIYDMAGNMWEWTTEVGVMPEKNSNTADTNYQDEDYEGTDCVRRGGSFDVGGNISTIFSHGDSSTSHGSTTFGFRVVLYFK